MKVTLLFYISLNPFFYICKLHIVLPFGFIFINKVNTLSKVESPHYAFKYKQY